jgi:hypothetical protein
MEGFDDPRHNRPADDVYVPSVSMADTNAARFVSEIAKVLVEAATDFPVKEPKTERSKRTNERKTFTLRAENELDAEFEAVVQNWLDEHREQLEDALRAIILVALLAAVTHALRAWLDKLGYSHCSRARSTPEMEAWVSERVASDAQRVGDTIQARIREIVKSAQSAGDSHERTMQRIREFLNSPRKIEELLHEIGMTSAYAATNYGAFLVNSIAGAETKFWITSGDYSVCSACAANEAQGPVPIGQPFKSGHLAPPAHSLCPCFNAYSILQADTIDAALTMFSVVCQNGPS